MGHGVKIRVDASEWMFLCPGCGFVHGVPRDGRWTFNGDICKPSFSPSLIERTGTAGQTHDQAAATGWSRVCHSVIAPVDGVAMIGFQSDCTHGLRGRIVELPDYPADGAALRAVAMAKA